MEALTRLVADSFARHGFDRPVDSRRLHWSRWFRCDSTHSLLVVPSKPGVFALAEEIMDLGSTVVRLPCSVGESTPQPLSSSPAGTAFIAADVSPGLAPTKEQSPAGTAPIQTPLPPSACSPSSSSPKTTTWPSLSTACSPAPIPCARAWRPGAVSCASWSSKTSPAPQHLQRLKPVDDLLRRKSLRNRRRFPVVAGVDRLRSHSPCGSDTPVRQCRHRSNSSPRNKGRTSVGCCTVGPESGFRSQPESSLSSPPPLRLLNREGFSTGRRS